MQVLGIGPDWLLIWLVSWSLNRSLLDSAIAGVVLGAIQDGLTTDYPSRILVYGAIGLLTARLHQQRYIKEEPIAVVLIVFFMTLLAEGAIALQYYLQNIRPAGDLWLDYQQIALTSAVLGSLWSPLLYYPLREWWRVARE
jgi:rod shape-determining protein MreD